MKSLTILLRATVLLLLLLPGRRAMGQTFQPATGPLLVQEMAFEQANECYLYLTNPSGDTLRLKWRQLEISLPDGWDVDICDYGACYIGVPPNGTMSPVYDSIQPYIKLIVQPGTTPGVAWCWFRVHEVDNAANFVDLYFSLFTPGTTPVTTASSPSTLRVFPNPARDFLVIDHQSDFTAPARMSDLTGRCIWQENLAPYSQTHIPVAGWPGGLYFLQTGQQTRRIVIDRP